MFFFLSFFFRLGRTFAWQIKEKGACQRLFCSSLGWRDKPRQSGPISGCQRRSDCVSGTRRRQPAKPGEPPGLRIGPCDGTGFGWLGRAIGATECIISHTLNLCNETSGFAEQNTSEAQANLKRKKVQFCKHARYDATDQRGHDESCMVVVPETRLVDPFITEYSITGVMLVLWNGSQRKRLFILSILR